MTCKLDGPNYLLLNEKFRKVIGNFSTFPKECAYSRPKNLVPYLLTLSEDFFSVQPTSSYNFGTMLNSFSAQTKVNKNKKPTIKTIFDLILNTKTLRNFVYKCFFSKIDVTM